MAQAKNHRDKMVKHFTQLDRQLRSLGINTAKFGFYDQPKFLARESQDGAFLDKYGEWVTTRPFGKEYGLRAKNIVPRLARLVHSEFVEHGLEGGCVNASGMISRILDRLGIWSVAVAGSLTLDVDDGRIRRVIHYFDEPDFPGAVLGHAWVIAPPYKIVDATIALQHWKGDDMRHYVPPYVLAIDEAKKIRPRVNDLVSKKIRQQTAANGWLDSDLHYRLAPHLKNFGIRFPAYEIVEKSLRLHYVPVGVRQTDVPLEQINVESAIGRPAIEFWREKVVPEFSEMELR
jgi:hypothetical protein